MGTEKRLYVDQYYPQRDSSTRHGDRMCFSSTCAMAVKFLKPGALKGSNADDDYLRTVFKYGDTTNSQAQVRALRDYGIVGNFILDGNRRFIESEINAGYPVAVGFLHHGQAAYPRGGGHWILCIGYTDTHLIVHDPYGELDNVNGGYPKPGVGGKSVKYSWKNFLKRWEVDGPGTGWAVSFRRIGAPVVVKPSSNPTQTRPTYPNTWDGVAAAAKAAGSLYPQLVAAQWALESGHGKHVSGKHNYFGLKGTGSTTSTKEFINGQWVTITDDFIDFPDLYSCVEYLVLRWYRDYKTHKGVNNALTLEGAAAMLVREGYATDPRYAEKLKVLVNTASKKTDV